MKNNSIGEWRPISELRKVSMNISGKFYLNDYVSKYKLENKKYAEVFGNNPCSWIPELIEVTLCDNEVMYRTRYYEPYNEKKDTFFTSLGKFVSDNHGEFGGKLITPKGEIYGNFEEVFECCYRTYAIDSLSHLGYQSFTLYIVGKNYKEKVLFSTEKFNKESRNNISFKALYLMNDVAYILASGFRIYHKSNANDKYKNIAYLFKINKCGFTIEAEFEYNFSYVKNMIVNNNHMFVGMDKIVADVNITTKETVAYSPISMEAENSIVKV